MRLPPAALLAVSLGVTVPAAAAAQARPVARRTAPAADAAAVRRAIEAANLQFVAALKRGDAAGAAANYAEDAIVMMANFPAWQGRGAIERGFAEWLGEAKILDETLTIVDVMLVGDVAVETGAYAERHQAPQGAMSTDKGKYLVVWKMQGDGTWKVVRDISNSDLPPKP